MPLHYLSLPHFSNLIFLYQTIRVPELSCQGIRSITIGAGSYREAECHWISVEIASGTRSLGG